MKKIELKKVRSGEMVTFNQIKIVGMSVYLDCPIHMEEARLMDQSKTFNRIQKWLAENHPANFSI